MRTKNIRFLFSSVAFCLILYMLLYLTSLIFMPKDKNEQTTIGEYNTYGYRGEIKNSIDVLVIGNSNVYSGFSPIEYWNKYGITSYASGKVLQSPAGDYKVLKDSLKYQNPKLVAIEMDGFYTGLGSIVFDSQNVNNSNISKHKYLSRSSINTSIFHNLYNNGLGRALGYWLPVIKYHNRWRNLVRNDLNVKDDWHYDGKGFIFTYEQKPYDGSLNYMGENTGKIQRMSETNQDYLKKIVKLCNDKNIKIILFSIPTTQTWNYQRHNAVSEFAKSYNIDYVDFNLNCKELNLDWTKDSEDGGQHLNVYGAVKFTDYFGAYINKKYSLEPEKDENICNRWLTDSQRFDELLKNSINNNEKA